MINIYCEKCHIELEAPNELAGHLTTCPQCRTEIRVPFVPHEFKGEPMNDDAYKECDFCAESIKINAKKCKHCGETLDPILRMAEEAKRTPNVYMNAGGGGAAASSSSSSGNPWYNPSFDGCGGCLLVIFIIFFVLPCIAGMIS